MVTLHNLLESCQFKELWEELAVCLGVVADVTSFEDSIRECEWGGRGGGEGRECVCVFV